MQNVIYGWSLGNHAFLFFVMENAVFGLKEISLLKEREITFAAGTWLCFLVGGVAANLYV